MSRNLVGKVLKCLCATAAAPPVKGRASNLVNQLQGKIRASGPMTVADYMKEVLTNPTAGYYMNRDVLGQQGDFITSPEVSQFFGEMLAVWCLNEWQKVGSPTPLQLVELGPGRGTLADDILRVFRQFGIQDNTSLHLVEVSQYLSKLQELKLCGDGTQASGDTHISRYGVPVHWYTRVQDIPAGFTCFVAHEFFDALPIHKFQKTNSGWREVLVDVDPDRPNSFRFVISRMPTPGTKLFIKADETRDHVEVSPQSGVIVQHLASRIEEDGGFVLIADYGHTGDKKDTFRAFREHQLHDPLCEAGTADLTADVDFSYLRDTISHRALTFGPVSQREFLQKMGIDVRLQVLLQQAEEKERENLLSAFNMIMDQDKMGQRFKFFAMFPNVLKDHLARFPVTGFY